MIVIIREASRRRNRCPFGAAMGMAQGRREGRRRLNTRSPVRSARQSLRWTSPVRSRRGATSRPCLPEAPTRTPIASAESPGRW